MKLTNANLRRGFFAVLLFGLALVLGGCGLSPRKVSLSDPKIELLLEAMEQVDRAAFGFTAVTTNDQVRLELRRPGGAYDAMLHVYGATSRTIAFRRTEAGYRWISEQETHQGPKWHQTVDGTFRELLLVEYQTDHVNGIPTNQLYIRYIGSDPNLTNREFTLAEIQSILESWRRTPVETKPPDLPGAGFDPAPLMFVLFMLGAFFVACVLALILGVLCLVVGAALLASGIVSAAMVIGILRRSVSAGFRAFFVQLGAIMGMVGSGAAVAIVAFASKANWNAHLLWLSGVMIGLFAGIFVAWMFGLVWNRIALEFTRKLECKGN